MEKKLIIVNSIEEIYCIIYEIVKYGIEKKEKRERKSKLTTTELITILIEGHRRELTIEKQLYINLQKDNGVFTLLVAAIYYFFLIAGNKT